ncbi:MAG: pyridoxamine 5'-phosphate oxidase family protein [Butyrivibrio sp.]|nr:pyridoxamine 5'-phosphate oxidase family protein [Acetatifactor muris]MCM1560778.1 pyridoxamine 5'-phosphate oxidase family protein [Butyrivibrio sp.]
MLKNPEQTIGKMIDKAGTCFLSYVDGEGFPITKAMLKPREREGIRVLWFSTNTSSNKVKCFRDNSKASVYFVDRRFFRGISLVGTVEVLETPEAKERLWERGDTMYYKEGVTDPDYCVLKFTAEKGRYYSSFKSVDFEIYEGGIG